MTERRPLFEAGLALALLALVVGLVGVEQEERGSMNLSKTMVVNYLTLIAAVFALPQLVAVLPEGAIPYVALAQGVAAVAIAGWDRYFGVITVMGILSFVAGVLALPQLVALIPPTATNVVVLLTSILALITRANGATTPMVPLSFPVVKPVGSGASTRGW